MKRVRSAVIVLMLLTAFSYGSAAAAKIPITVWFYTDSAAVTEWAKAYEKAFNAANPDIELHFDLVAYTAVSETVLVAAVAGTGPDISYLGGNLIPSRIALGMTLPLNRFLDKYPEKSDFVPELFKFVTDEKGQIHALPIAMWGTFDLYSRRVFTETGVSLPQDWNSLISAVRKITTVGSDNKVTRYGYVAVQNDQMALYNLHMAMEQLGKGMIYMGDARVDLVNDRGIRAANYMRDLWQAGMPDNSSAASAFSASIAGKVGIQGYATYNLLYIDPKDSADLEPRRVVGPEPGNDIVRYNCGALYILPTSKHPNEAWRVLKDFLSVETSESYLKAQISYLPVRKTMLSRMSRIVSHPLAIAMANIMYSPMTTYGAVHHLWTYIRVEGGNIILKALQGKAGIQTALEEAERTMNAILADRMGVK